LGGHKKPLDKTKHIHKLKAENISKMAAASQSLPAATLQIHVALEQDAFHGLPLLQLPL